MKLRHKPRKGMDGLERESSRITSISLSREDEEEVEDGKLTYDDILQMKMKSGSRPVSRDVKRKSKSRSRSSSPKSSRNKNKVATVEAGTQPDTNAQLTNGVQSKQAPGSSTQTQNVRPQTGLSVMSQDYDLDSMVNVVGVGPKTVGVRGGALRPSVPPPSREAPSGSTTPKRVMSDQVPSASLTLV